MKPNDSREVITLEELRLKLGIGRRLMSRAARQGLLPIPLIVVGGKNLVSRAAVDKLLDGASDRIVSPVGNVPGEEELP